MMKSTSTEIGKNAQAGPITIEGTARPDGSLRKTIKIRPNYIPREEIPKYQPPHRRLNQQPQTQHQPTPQLNPPATKENHSKDMAKLIGKFQNTTLEDTNKPVAFSNTGGQGSIYNGAYNYDIKDAEKNAKKRKKRKEKESGEEGDREPNNEINHEDGVKKNLKQQANDKPQASVNGNGAVHEEEKKSNEDEVYKLTEGLKKVAIEADDNTLNELKKKERQLKKKLRQIENLEQKKSRSEMLTLEELEKINKKDQVLQQLESLKV